MLSVVVTASRLAIWLDDAMFIESTDGAERVQ